MSKRLDFIYNLVVWHWEGLTEPRLKLYWYFGCSLQTLTHLFVGPSSF
jgi:hypothetical protein